MREHASGKVKDVDWSDVSNHLPTRTSDVIPISRENRNWGSYLIRESGFFLREADKSDSVCEILGTNAKKRSEKFSSIESVWSLLHLQGVRLQSMKMHRAPMENWIRLSIFF